MKITLQNSFGPSISSFFRNHYGKILFLLIVGAIAYGFYFVFTIVYPTLVSPEPIDPSEVASVQEKINLQRYEAVSKTLEEKQKTGNGAVLPDLF